MVLPDASRVWSSHGARAAQSGAGLLDYTLVARRPLPFQAQWRSAFRPPAQVVFHPAGRWLITTEFALPRGKSEPDLESRTVMRDAQTLMPIRVYESWKRVFSVSRDGRKVLTADRLRSVWLCDIGNPTSRRRLGSVSFLRHETAMLSPSGLRAVTRAELPDRVTLWDVGGGKSRDLALRPRDLFGFVNSESELFVGSGEGVYLWNTKTHRVSATAFEEQFYRLGQSTAFAVSPSGTRVATIQKRNRLVIWDTVRWEAIREIVLPGDDFRSMSMSDSGDIVAAASNTDRSVVVASVATGESKKVFQGEAPVHNLSLTLDGRLLAVGGARYVAVLRR